MNIKIDKDEGKSRFDDLYCGDVFEYEDLLFIKIFELMEVEVTKVDLSPIICSEKAINAVCLSTGFGYRIEHDTKVKPLTGEFIYKENKQ